MCVCFCCLFVLFVVRGFLELPPMVCVVLFGCCVCVLFVDVVVSDVVNMMVVLLLCACCAVFLFVCSFAYVVMFCWFQVLSVCFELPHILCLLCLCCCVGWCLFMILLLMCLELCS